MGIGDDIMATGMARGAAARGVRIAFGDGHQLRLGPFSKEVFQDNPNIARDLRGKIEWVHYYKSNRGYNRQGNGRWIWNYDWKAKPGEFFFNAREMTYAIKTKDAVLIEPNVPWKKQCAPNKDWGLANFQAVADMLRSRGYGVFQLSHGERRLKNAQVVETPNFRCAVAALSGFNCVICPEGGLHHAAAAVGTPAVVLFGGFVPPEVLGYDAHQNLTGDATEACGSFTACDHCKRAMASISVEEVYSCAVASMFERRNVA